MCCSNCLGLFPVPTSFWTGTSGLSNLEECQHFDDLGKHLGRAPVAIFVVILLTRLRGLFRLGRLEQFLAPPPSDQENSSFVIQVLAREEQADDLREDGRRM